MLPSTHPHAWDATRAWEHMPPDQRRLFPHGGRLVVTPELEMAVTSLPSAIARGATVVVSGPPGVGKSTVLAAISAVADVNVAEVSIPPGTRPKEQWSLIAAAVTGASQAGTTERLRQLTRDYLTAVPTLLMVDEAQNIGLAALQQLRWLWTLNIPGFALLLAGAGLNEYLNKEPQISSRISRRILLTPKPLRVMRAYLTRWHPGMADVDDAVVTFVDTTYAHGSWRAWSWFLFTLYNDWHHTGPVDQDLAQQVINAIRGIPAA